MADYTDWIGRSESSTERIDATRLQRLVYALDHPGSLSDGDPLPSLFHYCTHAKSVPRARLDTDGHPSRGDFIPPIELPRRMWAGSRLEFTRPIHIGDLVTKRSEVSSVIEKQGTSGPLIFVTVDHELSVDGEVSLREEQDLVYRARPDAGGARPEIEAAPTSAHWSKTITPDTVLLFQYSALSHNAHRIHYDRDYAVGVEGYEGLVVQGPLIATLLAHLAVFETGQDLARFSFRARYPLFDTAPFTIAGRTVDGGADLWAVTPAGGLAMSATAEFR